MDGGHSQLRELPDRANFRDGTWGSPTDREFVTGLALEIAARAGYGVCVLEVVQVDHAVECVAVHGPATGNGQHVGDVRTLTDAESRSIPREGSRSDLIFTSADGRVRQVGRSGGAARVPGPRPDEDEERWVPGDRLVAHLRDDQHELRAVLLLDQPDTGQRPRESDLSDLTESLDLAFRALVAAIERELLTQQVRIARAVRRVVRSAAVGANSESLLDLMHVQLSEAFRADDLHISLFGTDEFPASEDHIFSAELFEALIAAARRAWVLDDVVIMEAGRVWGDEELGREHSAELDERFAEYKIGTIVLVPIGGNTMCLGTLTVVRNQGRPRWTDSESRAALDVCRDLGHALLNARALEREQAQNVELQQRDDHRTELIATLSHELNNPIGVILGHLEILAARPDLDPLVHRSLAAINRSAQRIGALSEGLLVLRMLENPLHPLELLPVDLVALLAEVVDTSRVLASQAEVALEMEAPGHEVVVMGARTELTQAFTNLVSNSIKYNDPGGKVCLSILCTEGGVELTCADDGIGISEPDLSDLFNEFFRSTNSDAVRRPGHGLGLTIVQRVVERHGGSIEVESRLGQGSTFRIILPTAG